MLDDVIGVCRAVAQTLGRITLQQLGQDQLGLRRKVVLHLDWLVNDVAKHLLPVLWLVVRGPAAKHLVEKRTLFSKE